MTFPDFDLLNGRIDLREDVERRDGREARRLEIFSGNTVSTGERGARSPVPMFVLPVELIR